MALHVGNLRAECEGMHGGFVGMSAGFPLAVSSDTHIGGLSGCAPGHTQLCLKIFAYIRWQTRKQGGFGSVSVTLEGLYVESSEME